MSEHRGMFEGKFCMDLIRPGPAHFKQAFV